MKMKVLLTLVAPLDFHVELLQLLILNYLDLDWLQMRNVSTLIHPDDRKLNFEDLSCLQMKTKVLLTLVAPLDFHVELLLLLVLNYLDLDWLQMRHVSTLIHPVVRKLNFLVHSIFFVWVFLFFFSDFLCSFLCSLLCSFLCSFLCSSLSSS